MLTISAALGISELAVDTAGDHVSRTEAVQLKQNGTRLFIQALTWWPRCGLPTSVPSTRVDSLRNAHEAGMDIAGYLLLDTHSTGREAVDRARAGMPDDLWDALEWVAVDYEIPGECRPAYNIPFATIVDACDRLQELGKRVEVVINGRPLDYDCLLYTNYDNWVSVLGNPTRPEGWALWNAAWDGDPDFDFPRLRYGGWQDHEVLLEQYNGGSYKDGVFVDLNAMRYQPAPKSTPPPPPMYWDGRFWVMPDKWKYEPATGDWYTPDGTREWSACLPWGGRHNYTLDIDDHGSDGVFDRKRGFWTVAPAC